MQPASAKKQKAKRKAGSTPIPKSKPSKAGLIWRGDAAEWVSFGNSVTEARDMELVSTKYGPIAQLARAHD